MKTTSLMSPNRRPAPRRAPGLALMALLSASLVVLTACGGGGGDGGGTPAGPTPASRLYVSRLGAVLSYDNADSVSGAAPVNRTISGAATTLAASGGIAVDMPNDRLYVANLSGNSVLVFDNASAATGNVAPSRTIAGPATTLSLTDGASVFFDTTDNRLYVSSGNSILVFDNAGAATGNVAPSRTLSGAATTLSGASGVHVDTARNKLYVASYSSDRILVFDNASAATGNIAPSRTIAGVNTTLDTPVGIFVDTVTDRLYVANLFGNSVLVFDNASARAGNIAPDRIIAGAATALANPASVFVDTGTDRVYVANNTGNSIVVFDNAGTATGDIAPTRTINLPAGSGPAGVFVDITPLALPSQAALDGFARSDGGFSAGSPGIVGDIESSFPGVGFRGFYSFDISMIPAGAVVISVTLRLYQSSVIGAPYASLGNVVVDHVDYGASLDGGDYSGGTLTGNIGVLSSSAVPGYKVLDVTGQVRGDIAGGRTRSQYRLRFSSADIDNDSAEDSARFVDAEICCAAPDAPPQLVIRLAP